MHGIIVNDIIHNMKFLRVLLLIYNSIINHKSLGSDIRNNSSITLGIREYAVPYFCSFGPKNMIAGKSH